MKNAKVKQGLVPPVCLALMVLFVWLSPCATQAAAKDYAVQIAALRTQQCADELRSGLLARGLEAYWVRAVLPEHGLFYRVRLGKFPSVETAYTYAESLLDSGLLESYAITTYEMPMSVPLRDTTQASLEVQEFIQQRPSPRETNDLLAAIGARQWWLPANRNLFATTPQLPPANMGMTRREMLVFALGRHEWRLNHDLSVLFVRAPVVASTKALAVNTASPKSEAATPSRAMVPAGTNQPIIPSSNQPPRPQTSLNASSLPASRPVETAIVNTAATAPLTPPPPAKSSSPPPIISDSQPLANSGFGAARNPAPEIGRGNRTTTAPRGIAYNKVRPPRLQASAEMRNGQLWMKLRNLDGERSFAGTARVTISDDRNSNEISPMQFTVPPEGEIELPVNETVADGANWMLMVFDDGGALRMLRGQTIGQKPAAPPQAQAQTGQSEQVELNPPAYVTGVYDATAVTANAPQVVTPGELSGPTNPPNSSGGAVSVGGGGSAPPNSLAAGEAPAQLTVTPRQIAATTENVTLEFEIASPQPLQYISVTLAAGDYRDTRQALMSTTRGRVPFLVPAIHARGAFLFEIKDESGRVLAGGAGDFRQMGVGR